MTPKLFTSAAFLAAVELKYLARLASCGRALLAIMLAIVTVIDTR